MSSSKAAFLSFQRRPRPRLAHCSRGHARDDCREAVFCWAHGLCCHASASRSWFVVVAESLRRSLNLVSFALACGASAALPPG